MITPLLLAAALVVSPAPQVEHHRCNDPLAKSIYEQGFRGKNVKEAWAIAMRESGGRPNAVSSTGDYGVFQFNRAAHGRQSWWDTRKLLTRDYNVRVAYRMSVGGKWWGPWDLSGSGRWLGKYTPASVGAKYTYWYDKFPKKCEYLSTQ